MRNYVLSRSPVNETPKSTYPVEFADVDDTRRQLSEDEEEQA